MKKPGELFNKMKKKGFAPVTSATAKAKKHKNWIAGAIKKPGSLKKELGVKSGNKIPTKTLAAAAKKGGKEGKRARLAETLKSFHKAKKGKRMEKKMCKKHEKMHCKVCYKKHEKKV